MTYNYEMLRNKMRTFENEVLIQFFVSSTSYEHHVFIIRKIICTRSFV